MRRFVIISSLFALLANADESKLRPDRSWLVGAWLMMDGRTEFPDGCGTHLPVQYFADGTSGLFGESWVWRLDGDKLTETQLAIDPTKVDPAEAEIGKTFRSTLHWITKDRLSREYSDGDRYEFLRCPVAK